MNIQKALSILLEGGDLEYQDMRDVMSLIMSGEATPAQIGGFLIALRMKGETVDEVAAAASVMRELASSVKTAETNTVDIVGTGGDTLHTFNVSTASSLVAAAAGVRIAKHGNRSVSSKSGAADLLEAAGVNVDLTPEQVGRCVDEVGVGFMFAPNFHAAMRHAIGPRREMAVRTIFNLLGPLTNPAGAPNQVLGVFDVKWVKPLAEVLNKLGSRHVMVVHSDDGMDEISCCAPTQVAELRDGVVSEYIIDPADFGMTSNTLSEIQVAGPEESLEMVHRVLANTAGAPLDMIKLNAGAAIYVAGIAKNFQDGVTIAGETIAAGKANEKLKSLVELSQTFNLES